MKGGLWIGPAITGGQDNKSLQLTPWRPYRIGAWSSEFHAGLFGAAAQLSSVSCLQKFRLSFVALDAAAGQLRTEFHLGCKYHHSANGDDHMKNKQIADYDDIRVTINRLAR